MKPIIKSLVPTNYWFPVLLTEDKFKYGGFLPIKMVNLRSTSPAATGTGYCDASGNSTHPDFLKFLTLSGTSVNPGKSTVNYAFMKNNFAGITASDVFYASAVSATVPAGETRNQILAKNGAAREYRNVSGFNGKSWKLYSDAPTLKYSKTPFEFNYTTGNPDEAFAIEGGESCIRNIRCQIDLILTYDDYVACETGDGERKVSFEIIKNINCLEEFPAECCKTSEDYLDFTDNFQFTGDPEYFTRNQTSGTNSDGSPYVEDTLQQRNTCTDLVAFCKITAKPSKAENHVKQNFRWSKNNRDEFTRLPGESCCAEFIDQSLHYRIDLTQKFSFNDPVGDTSATESLTIDGTTVELGTAAYAAASGFLTSGMKDSRRPIHEINCDPTPVGVERPDVTRTIDNAGSLFKSSDIASFVNAIITNNLGGNAGYCLIPECYDWSGGMRRIRRDSAGPVPPVPF